MWSWVWVALQWEGTEGRHVLGVAGHEEQLAGTLAPAHEAGVQTQLCSLVITGGPVTAPCRLNIQIWGETTHGSTLTLHSPPPPPPPPPAHLPVSWSRLEPAGLDSRDLINTDKSTNVTLNLELVIFLSKFPPSDLPRRLNTEMAFNCYCAYSWLYLISINTIYRATA